MLQRTARTGYTLLEVILAMAIAIIMVAALYVAMDTQIRQMEEGRIRVEKSTIARALFQRINQDLTSSLAPIQPTSSSASGTGTTMTETATSSTLNFQIGVKGDSTQVTIYQTRLSRPVIRPPESFTDNQTPYSSDIRRISYFLSSAGDGGLARQEIRMVTSEEVDDVPADVDDYSKVIATEVQQFEVRYFDGNSWIDSWDGSTPGPDGKTPQGPPRAIEITIGLRLPGEDELKMFKHVIAFPAAPGAPSEQTQSMTTK